LVSPLVSPFASFVGVPLVLYFATPILVPSYSVCSKRRFSCNTRYSLVSDINNNNNNNINNINNNDLTSVNSISNYFLNPIPNKFIKSKNKTLNIFINIGDLDTPAFGLKVKSNVDIGMQYTVFVKVRYHTDHFFMAGNQWGWGFNDLNSIDDLYQEIDDRLKGYFDIYRLGDGDIVYIQVSFHLTDIKLLSEFSIDKPDHVTKFDSSNIEKMLKVPVSVNPDSLGEPLVVDIYNGCISNIYINIRGVDRNFLDLIRYKAKFLKDGHKDNIINFDGDFKFYKLTDSWEYVLAIRKFIDGSIEKIRYSLAGAIVSHTFDSIQDINNNTVIRSSAKREIVLVNNKVVFSKQDVKLRAIKRFDFPVLFVEDQNIGVIDCEVYIANDEWKHVSIFWTH